ncbi:PDZ domain-containing protein [Tahibacter amnicola]|uniref:PDZ domain-containing protein n=1 Tax=Tahibacter amnicola TaxID=2976241 RepID=A0ABY6BIU7_9GAMM|nr:PDZ domain-containing protein [Tahibacter amnicola]UXI69938.1 PDZ domain-containing protein [Tahibacter amnicola]
MHRIRLFALLCLLLSGCATVTRHSVEPGAHEPAAARHFTAVPGRDPAALADLRAAPAPEQTEVLAGTQPAADEASLATKGYVLVGNSHFGPQDGDPASAIAEQARRVGADRVLTYPPGITIAAYYVRLRLPFGATFRDLSASERRQFNGGVRLGDIVGDSPASRANLLSGDVVLTIDGKAVENRAAFQSQLREKMGKVVVLRIHRNAETIERRVKLGATFANQ